MATTKYNGRFNKDFFEVQAWHNNALICGIDEVGRGCLAGPVVTAAAILLPHKKSRLIKDSKLMTPEELQIAYRWLVKNSVFSYAFVHHRDIDKYNIYYATLRAMRRAVLQLLGSSSLLPEKILVDAMPLSLGNTSFEALEVLYFPFGEKRSSSIAAASIIAKVTRDNLMRRLDPVFPVYKFANHKGYCTKTHQEALKKAGKSIVHRDTFVSNKEWLLAPNAEQQLSLLDTANPQQSFENV